MGLVWEDAGFIAFDFETSGTLPEYALQPWRVASGDAWTTSLATVMKGDDGFVIGGTLDPTPRDMRDMLELALDTNRTIVGWNTPFDVSWLMAYGLRDLCMKAKWLDGMLLWRHWFIEPEYEIARHKKKSYSLKEAVKEFLPKFAGYEQEVDFHATDSVSRATLHHYNIQDTVFTLRLAKKFYSLLSRNPQQLRAALIEAHTIPLVAEANLYGMHVDRLAARELEQHLTDVANAKLESLAPHGVTEKVVRSPLQLSALMFDQWKLPVLKENTSKKTGKVSRSTDKEVLHELAFVDSRAKEVKEYREALNNRTKFATAPMTAAEYNGDGRARPSANMFGTYSGRMTYSSKQGKNKDTRQTGFALHQEKRDKLYRSIIVAPPGHTLVEFDAAGQEFRWMAVASGDETMLSLCFPGEDAHTYMGAQIVQRDYHEMIAAVRAEDEEAVEYRRLGKLANLSLQYRTSAKKLRVKARTDYGLPMELPEAQHIHATYPRAYPGVKRYWASQIAQTKQCGYVETFAGRRVEVRGNWERDGWSMGSTAINYRIQGTGADQKYLALKVLKPYLVKIQAMFAWDLHDGLYFYIPDEHVERACVEILYLLNNLPYEKAWNFSPPIPLPWDCKVGKSWGKLKEVHL